MRMLILKFPYSSLFGGGEQHTLRLVEGLQARGHECFLVSTCSVLLEEFKKRHWACMRIMMPKEPVSKGTIALFPFLAPYAMLRLAILLARFRIRGFKVVYCLSLLEKILATPFARILKMRVIWMEHVEPDRWLSMNPYRWVMIRDHRRVHIVTISKVIKEKWIQLGFARDRIRVIYNGIDVQRFQPKGGRQRGGEERSFVVGCVGRMEAEKGMDVLIQAFAKFHQHLPLSKLVMIGEGSMRKQLEWLATTLECKTNIQFVGFQPEIEHWYAGFDLFVLPSVKREAFGMVLLEALASEVPAIASRLGGIPEIITHEQEGLLVPPGDSTALFHAMMWVAQYPVEAEAMAKRGRTKVEREFSLDRELGEFEKLLIGKG